MIQASQADQRRLLDLQGADTAIRQLQHRRANLAEQKALDENSATLSRISAEFATKSEQLERLALQQKRHEDEIAAVDARRKSEEGRMYSGLITSQKELEALRAELSSLRNRKNDLEDALLEIMEQREELEGVVTDLRRRHGELSGRVDELTAARDEAAREIDAELDSRHTERAKIAADLPAPVLAYYDELRAKKDGVGVAVLEGRTCAGCRLQLTPTEYEEARSQSGGGRLARCEQCGRIIVPT